MSFVQFLIVFFFGSFVGLSIFVIPCFYDFLSEKIEEKETRERMKSRKFDYVTNQVYFNNNKIDKVQNHLNSLHYKLDQIIDFINDNECSVKDDE